MQPPWNPDAAGELLVRAVPSVTVRPMLSQRGKSLPLRRRTLALILLTASVMALLVLPWPGARDAHVPPWPVAVNGETTGFVALGALDPRLAGPGARFLAAAATRGDWDVPPMSWEQSEVAADAWEASRSLAASAGYLPAETDVPAPSLGLPTWTGRSTGLAYALAYLDSRPLNPEPGSLARGRTVAATGVLTRSGLLLDIAYVPAKLAAAREAGATVVLVPSRSLSDARDSGEDLSAPGVDVVPVFSLKDALRYLCATGGESPACEWASSPGWAGSAFLDSDGLLSRVLACLQEEAASADECLAAARRSASGPQPVGESPSEARRRTK